MIRYPFASRVGLAATGGWAEEAAGRVVEDALTPEGSVAGAGLGVEIVWEVAAAGAKGEPA